jgi:hypothetical protein
MAGSVAACRANVAAKLASYRNGPATKPPDIGAFERQFFNRMIPALNCCFVHRGRAMEGKDGNPGSEVLMPCDAIMEDRGRMSASKRIRYEPETSILKLEPGDEIRLNPD